MNSQIFKAVESLEGSEGIAKIVLDSADEKTIIKRTKKGSISISISKKS
jgi:hypothetical protein